jgi:DNA-directed RNA polymerase specialized sigma24 family protein
MNGGLQTKIAPQATRFDVGEFPEAEAIRLAQQGDERGFERIYRLHSQRVYALCLRMMRGNSAEAEELTQESFLQLFRKIGTFRGESAFSTWLHRLAFNIVLMRLRRRSYQVVSMDEMLEPGGSDSRAPRIYRTSRPATFRIGRSHGSRVGSKAAPEGLQGRLHPA